MHDSQHLLHVGKFYFLKEKDRFTNELFVHGESTNQQAALTFGLQWKSLLLHERIEFISNNQSHDRSCRISEAMQCKRKCPKVKQASLHNKI